MGISDFSKSAFFQTLLLRQCDHDTNNRPIKWKRRLKGAFWLVGSSKYFTQARNFNLELELNFGKKLGKIGGFLPGRAVSENKINFHEKNELMNLLL